MRHLNGLQRAGIAAAGIVLSLAAAANASATAPTPPVPATTPVGAAPLIPAGAQVDGAAPLSEPVSFEVVLRSRDQAGLNAFTTAVSRPGSASYRHFLAAGEYASRFGPTASTIATVTSRLRALGLTVGTANGSILPVSGSISRIGAALHTSFRQYRLASGRVARANVSAPKLPAAVVGAVQAVVGLDTLGQFTHPVPTVRPLSSAAIASPAVSGALTPHLAGPTACSTISTGAGVPDINGDRYYIAPQLASYYGLTSSYTAGTRGSGVTVAIVELEPFLPGDISTYQSCYGTTTAVSTVDVHGGPSTGDGSGEAALDVEDVIGLAPDAAIRVYQGPLAANASDADVLAIYNAIANDDVAQVVTTSWGACEARTSSTLANGENTIFQQMASQGQSMFAATGDSGSADCDTPPGATTGLAVDDPASQPFVTGTGGTTLTTTTGPETTWNNGVVQGSPNAGGGGVSARWPMASWQTPLGTISGSSATPCGATGGTLCREVPDVSASADPNDGYVIFYTPPPGQPADWYIFGGTSAAAPTWAALTALIDASCGGHQLGQLNPALYQLSADFHDVTSGTNNALGAGVNSNKYGALAGYDMASGLGSPNGAALVSGLCPVPSGNGVGTMTVSPNLVPASSTATLTFTYTAPAGAALTNGKLSVVVPAGWSPPSVTPGTAGFTTASAGTVTVAGNTINVSGVATTADSTFTITYGNTSGGLAASTPTSQLISSFAAKEASTAGGTLTSLSASPQVSVGLAPDGSGTLAVSPTSVAVTAPTTLTFTYTPPAGGALQSGEVTIAVPSGWTPPQITNSANAGFVTASTGTLSIAGSTIRVNALSLSGTTLSVTYGDTGGGANPTAAATPPGSPTTSTFISQQKGTSGGTLTSLASPPTTVVVNGAGGGGGGGGAPPASLALLRVAGADRVATSVAASQTGFPSAHPASSVVLVRSDAFADALSGTPLAVSKRGPLLLTSSTALSTAASTELQRVLPVGGTVYLLGGTSALSPSVASSVTALGFTIVRIAGPDRFTTAALVAASLGNPATVFEADGTNFPDALSAGTAAAEVGGAILLTAGSSQSPATASYLAAHPGDKRYAIGGPAASADPGATAFVGADRFATSVAVAQAFFPAPGSIGLASGVTFPDALSGGSVAAMNHGPIVLVPSTGTLPVTVVSYLAAAKSSATAAWLFGGINSVNADVFNQAASLLTAS